MNNDPRVSVNSLQTIVASATIDIGSGVEAATPNGIRYRYIDSIPKPGSILILGVPDLRVEFMAKSIAIGKSVKS